MNKLTIVPINGHKPLKEYAKEIKADWLNISPYALPYLKAMATHGLVVTLLTLSRHSVQY